MWKGKRDEKEKERNIRKGREREEKLKGLQRDTDYT